MSLNLVSDIVTEATFNWCVNQRTGYPLRFDFYLPDFHLIIELDGRQHWEQVSNWKSPLDTQEHDVYKMTVVEDHGLTIIRIFQEDVLYDTYDWKAGLEPLLKAHTKPVRIMLDNNTGLYQHIGYDTKRLLELC